jgi:hypothetical protein
VAKVFAPDVIHAFDYNGLMLGAGPARRGPGKFVFTICGGPVPRARVPFMRPLVVFSPELRVGLQKQGYPEENILVNAGRIEPAQNVHPKAWLDEFRREIGISEMEPVILMISRIVHGKLSALLHFVKTADCAAEFRQMSFLIVGAADDPHSLEQLREAISRVNAKHGRSVIWWTDRESGHASRLLPMASVVVGMGRTAYEAMSLGIPTMVMGAYGFSAVACEETCNMLKTLPRKRQRQSCSVFCRTLPQPKRSVWKDNAGSIHILALKKALSFTPGFMRRIRSFFVFPRKWAFFTCT